MVRLKKPVRPIPPGVTANSGSNKSTDHGGSSSSGNNKSYLQLLLMVVIAICVILTVVVNLKSTSSAILDAHHYSAAVNQAMNEFKRGISSTTTSTSTIRTAKSSAAAAAARDEEGTTVPSIQNQIRETFGFPTIPIPNKDVPDKQTAEELHRPQNPVQSSTTTTIKSEIASLSCTKHGGPSDEFAQEMVYWSDIPSDSLYVSPLKQKFSNQRQYMTFEPDGGGWNNIRMAMETVVGLAAAMGRTLVLPPQKQMYLLGDGKNKQQRHFGFEDFFPMQQMAKENAALDMITMQEFLETEGLTGNLKDKVTGQASFPPGNRTNWDGINGQEYDILREWLRNVTLVPQWKPDNCMAAFPAKGDHQSVSELREMQVQAHKEGLQLENYIGKPVPVDAPAVDRMKENLNRRHDLCVYDEDMQQEMVVHFACAHKLHLRLLVHFYAFIFMEDWREDLWMKRFMRDHMRYNDDIQCAAARVVHEMREFARANDPQGNPEGLFDTFHVRRGDFQYGNTRIDADKIHEHTKDILTPNSTIFIATDERDKSFFNPLKRHYNIKFLDDFIATELTGVNTNYYGMIDQLVASRGRIFFGCWFSTFTGFINRMRGYRSVKDKLPGHEEGILPTSYYYVPKDRLTALHQYQPLSGSFFAREFPTSWRDIDRGIGELPPAVVD